MTLQINAPFIATLQNLLGDDWVDTSPETCANFRVHGLIPQCVVSPANAQELAQVLAIAQQNQVHVTPWGGGSQQLIGAPPSHHELVVCTRRLKQVLIHEPDDLTISVEAGMTFGELRTYLAGHGQMLPIDPAVPDQATIGGLIATAADSPRRLGYGTIRDLLIGIQVAEISGELTKAGGMVVKNVSGFDMMKLYLGSFGTLAVITSANFKLWPIQRASASQLYCFAQAHQAFAMLDALSETQLTPTAVEYLNAAALATLQIDAPCALAIRAEGLPASVERHSREIQALAQRYQAQQLIEYQSQAEHDFWLSINNLAQTTGLGPSEALLKFSTLPSDLAATIVQLEHFAPVQLSARALNGVIYARFSATNAEQLQQIASQNFGMQWSATALDGAPRWGQVYAGAELMQRIKQEFDPQALLNAGRFVIASP